MGYCIGEEISGLKTIYKKSVSDRNPKQLQHISKNLVRRGIRFLRKKIQSLYTTSSEILRHIILHQAHTVIFIFCFFLVSVAIHLNTFESHGTSYKVAGFIWNNLMHVLFPLLPYFITRKDKKKLYFNNCWNILRDYRS